jgi:hypothetical protein
MHRTLRPQGNPLWVDEQLTSHWACVFLRTACLRIEHHWCTHLVCIWIPMEEHCLPNTRPKACAQAGVQLQPNRLTMQLPQLCFAALYTQTTQGGGTLPALSPAVQ